MASASKVKALVYGAIISLVLSGDSFVDSFQSKSLSTTRKLTSLNEYVPSGFTKESYRKFKEDEKKKAAKINLGGVGPRGFKSRSMQSFQEAMERGEATHLMPVFNAKEKIKKGELKQEDIPVSIWARLVPYEVIYHSLFVTLMCSHMLALCDFHTVYATRRIMG
jgi:hypothetical protein